MAIQSWLTSSFVRHFPQSSAGRNTTVALEGARNESLSFQVGVRQSGDRPQKVNVAVDGPKGWSVRVRRVGYVPVRHFNTPIETSAADIDGVGHIPGYVPDPLFDESELLLPVGETHAFWVNVVPKRGARAGRYSVRVTVMPEGGKQKVMKASVRLHAVSLKKRTGFPITHWFYADAIMDWYDTDGFDARFWQLADTYLDNYTGHGMDALYIPVFTPPLDGVKRPTQLLRVSHNGKGDYTFDWRDVKRYVALAKKKGIRYFEWCHPITQWGAKHAIRIYEGQGQDEKLLWRPTTGATSKTYRNFLSQYLPQLHQFLSSEKILNRSFFHVSDEPHGDEHLKNYKKARAMLTELAPWMTVMDALTDIRFARENLTDIPVPSIRTALDFHKEGIPSWCYYCCNPRGKYLNRLLDTPLPKIAMHGFLFYRWPFQGFLHWGYNYWYKSQTRELIDPFVVQDGGRWPGWAFGDTSVVYPGADGPIDSIRWEVFAESLQDYALLQTVGVDRDDRLLADLKSFEEFPKNEDWRQKARAKVFSMIKK